MALKEEHKIHGQMNKSLVSSLE